MPSVQFPSTMSSPLAQPLTLKNGLMLPNRLAKAAMAENLADKDLLPTDDVYSAYKAWAEGGWGLIITGIFTLPQMGRSPSC